MLINEAARKIKELPGRNIIVECLNFDDFWAFLALESENENSVAGAYDTVSKLTGEIGTFNPTEDLQKFSKATSISVEQFN